MIFSFICFNLVKKRCKKLQKIVFLGYKKWQNVRENKIGFTAKFIQDQTYRAHQYGASAGKISSGDFLG